MFYHHEVNSDPELRSILPENRQFDHGVISMQRGVDPTGRGLFATRSFQQGEPLGKFGGMLIPADAIDEYIARIGPYGLQVHDYWYLCPNDPAEATRLGAINHSCDPNVGLGDAVTLQAMTDIDGTTDEPVELLIDYALTGSPAGGFDGCQCRSSFCRGSIRRDDWQMTALQNRFSTYFPPFKKRLIRGHLDTRCALTLYLDQYERRGGGPSEKLRS